MAARTGSPVADRQRGQADAEEAHQSTMARRAVGRRA
jgi:hypothetical protein